MQKSTLRKADLLFSIVLMIFSVWILIESIKIFFNPFGAKFEDVAPESIKTAITQWYLSPALVPAILAVVLFILARILMRYAIKQGAKFDFFKKEKALALLHNREMYSFVAVVGLLCIYIFALMPLCRKFLNLFPYFQGFPFMIATFIYLFAMMFIFSEKKLKPILMSLLISAISAGIITYGFGVVAMIPLP